MAEQSKVRTVIMLEADAAALLLELAGGPRKQGEYLSELLRRTAVDKSNGEAALRREIGDLAGALAVTVARLRELAGQPERTSARKGGGA